MATLNNPRLSFPEYVMTFFFLVTVVLAASSFVSGKNESEFKTYIVNVNEVEAGMLTLGFAERKELYESLLARSAASFGVAASKVFARSSLMYSYKHVTNGFAARLNKTQLEALKNIKGYSVQAIPDVMLRLQTTYSSRFVGLDRATGVWPRSNFGAGVIIGVLDSGVWPESVSFGEGGISPVPSRWKGSCQNAPDFNSSNCNNKIVGARVYSTGAKANGEQVDVTPRDSIGHGTHTTSIAAGNFVDNAGIFGYANGTASGMAPAAHIAVYRVCYGVQGDCAASDILAAMDQAIEDGVDVISLSVGGIYEPLYENLLAIGAFHATEKGIFVSCSAGNDGPSYGSVANDAPWIMTVGASTVDRVFAVNVKLGNGVVLQGESLYPPGEDSMTEYPIAYAGGAGTCLDGGIDPNLVKGKLVICKRTYLDGNAELVMKGELVQQAGGAAMIVVNDESIWENTYPVAHVLPATNVGSNEGTVIAAYANSTQTPTASFQFEGTLFGTKSAPAVATFSSRGPSFSSPGTLKPDVIAPGVSVLAAWPSNLSPSRLPVDKRRVMFNTMTGTSMSCPHVSGLAALLKSVHPDWSPAAMKSALMTTADFLDKKGGPILDVSTNTSMTVFGTGAGHVNAEKAADPGLIYDIVADDYIPYLCGLNYSASQMNSFRKNVTCPPSSDANTLLGNLNYPSFTVLIKAAPLSVTFTRTVTNVGVAKSTYSVNVVPPDGMDVSVEPTTLAFTAIMEKMTYNVTFTAKSVTGTAVYYSQGSITWISTIPAYQVRSPISVVWNAGQN